MRQPIEGEGVWEHLSRVFCKSYEARIQNMDSEALGLESLPS